MLTTSRPLPCLTLLLASALAAGCVADDGDGAATAERTIAPAAPADSTPPGGAAVAPPPSISPATAYELVAPGAVYTCLPGTLCTGAWDPTVSKWRVFKLYTCATYAVSNWNGTGFYWDNQTGSPVSTFFDSAMRALFSFIPGGGQKSYDWTPVWYIKNC